MQRGEAGGSSRGYWRKEAGDLTAFAAALVGLSALTGSSGEVGCGQPFRICPLGLHGDRLASVKCGSILLLSRLDGLKDRGAHPLLCLQMPGDGDWDH